MASGQSQRPEPVAADAMWSYPSAWFVGSDPSPTSIYAATYDLRLVVLSVALAILGAFAAISISQQAVQGQSPWRRLAWIAPGALAMGGGTWAMHFVGMLAFDLPCNVHYEITTTFLSMIPGVLASAVAFYFVSHQQRTRLQIVGGSLLLGLGIGAMHYLGMAAMRLEGYIQYDPVRFTVSLVVAVLLASLALVIRSTAPPFRFSRTFLSASVMGIAIAGMHYVAMSSAYFIRGTSSSSPVMSLRKGDELAIAVTLVTGLWILLLTVITAAYRDRITARQLRASEHALQRRSRSLAMLSAGNQTLVRSDDEQELLQKMCVVAIETGGYQMAWIGYKVDDEESSVRPMASIGFEDEYLARIKISWGNGEEGQSPTGDAIRTGKPQISADLEADANSLPRRGHALKNGYRSSVSLPLVHRGETIGAFMIYADHPDAFDDVELPVLEEMAEDLAFGISAIRTRLAREQMEQKLARSYSLLQAAMDSAADGILVTSLMGRLESHNNKVRDVWGMPEGILESRSAAKAAQFMADCVADPEKYWLLQREIELNPHQTYTDVIELKNGRVLQCSSAPHRFEGIIFGRVSSYRDITDQREHERQLVYMANHDVLTGLPNRNLVLDRLQMGATQAERTGQRMAVLLFNLDRFNLLNDSLGHNAADELLKTVAQRLQTRARAGDTVARVGGDEFVVILSSVKHDEDAAYVGHQLLAAISEPVLIGGRDFHISASLGIALCPRDGHDAATLLMRANAAMHSAKARGGSCFQFVTTVISEQIARRVSLAERLRHAIKRQELSLHFQPQFSANSDQLVGAEALLRWRNSELGEISPAEFIPIAEETGLIIEVGQWVAETVCRTQRQWREAGLVPVKIAINLSARQLDNDDLLRALPACVELYGVATQWLEVEITEGALMKHPEKAASTLRAFKDLGFSVAIDDFGTGYSSLGYLKRFPVDKLKIDKSFIDEIPANMDDVAITRAIIAMAHELHLSVVAEGVETREQLEFLRMHGCDAVQGYLCGRPMPAIEFEGLLRSVTMRNAIAR